MEFRLGVCLGRALAAAVCLGMCLGVAGEEDMITPSIIGGVVSPAGDYPWMGALVSVDVESLTDGNFCGCSLIDERWILTAAHCLDGSRVGEVAVAFGNGDLEGDTVVVPIDLIVMYPDYFDVIGLDNDLALARLARPVEGVEPIRLSDDGGLVEEGQPVRVIGWGLTDFVQNDPDRVSKLRQADLSVLDRDWINSEDVLNGGVSERMLPIGTLDPLVTSSFGDSGGPMIVVDDGEDRLAGVTSWGTGCLTSVLPYSVYTNVVPYLEWIESVVNRDRFLWEKEHGVAVSESADAYRLGRGPDDENRPILSVDRDGLQTSLVSRPFSREWQYSLSYYDLVDRIWRGIDWDFGQGILADGSVELRLPQDVERETVLVRSEQVARDSSLEAELVDLALNQLVSGSFGDAVEAPSEAVRAFRISGLEPSAGYRILLSGDGGTFRYELRLDGGGVGFERSGVVEGRLDVPFQVEPGNVVWLYLLPVEAGVEFSVSLASAEVSSLSSFSSSVKGALEWGDAKLGIDGYYVDSFSVYGSPGDSDVFVVVEGSFDPAIMLLDTETLQPAGQSNAWSEGSPEYFIFNRSALEADGVAGLSLRVINGEPNVIGRYDLDVVEFVENRTLSLADEYDFRGLTVRDHTASPFNDFEYVDRVELTGLGSGKRFVQFTGFESFRPTFAVRNITDNVIVQEFNRAFCYEKTVIEFNAVAGKRYEAIVAASERSLNKNYFLEVSVTRPPSPYDRFSTILSDRESKMEKWVRRMKLGVAAGRGERAE